MDDFSRTTIFKMEKSQKDHQPEKADRARYSLEGCSVLFAYGTLRSGEERHHVLEKRLILKEDVRVKRFVMYDDGRGYPLLVKGKSADFVDGELFVFDDPDGSLLWRIDEIEGAEAEVPLENRLYKREKIEVKQGVIAWIYIYNHPVKDGAKVVRDWVRRGE
jgi:gamma-glutamylcyclotransferase (GGCT)/AIG2-like uncharacterized protein YtfP